MATPKFTPGSNEARMTTELKSLTEGDRPWQLISSGQGIERVFKFKTFKAAWSFMDSVAATCKIEKHHPEWSNTYNRVFVRWTTHNPAGLSEKDLRMATFCDEAARSPESSEIQDDNTSAASGLSQTADRATAAAGDCCGPAADPKESERKKVEQVEKEEGATGSVAGMGGQPS